MGILGTLGLAFGSAWVSGINLYAMVLTLGLLGRFAGLTLPGDLGVLTNEWVIGTALLLYFGGVNVLNGALILALMSVPIIMSMGEDALKAVPDAYREAALALGAIILQSCRHVDLAIAETCWEQKESDVLRYGADFLQPLVAATYPSARDHRDDEEDRDGDQRRLPFLAPAAVLARGVTALLGLDCGPSPASRSTGRWPAGFS